VEGELWSGWANKDQIFRESYRQPNGTHVCIEPSATVILCTSDNTPKDFPSNTEFKDLLQPNDSLDLARLQLSHPLVYSSIPHPQWSSGYDFRLSCDFHHAKSRETRVRFPVEEHLRNLTSSSNVQSLPVLANQHRHIFFWIYYGLRPHFIPSVLMAN
jgi:hypothetical protein